MYTLHLLVVGIVLISAQASESATSPAATLDRATVIGTSDGIVTQFLGIPFAQPPVGKLRLQLPRAITEYTGVINATAFGNKCIQQVAIPPTIPSNLTASLVPDAKAVAADVSESEDCLSINVIVPAGTKAGAKLPVAAWIYGGGFSDGSNMDQPGNVVVNRSIALDQPVIFVSMNYRLNAFGFLGGKEVQEAGIGNLGLQDQREAFRWVQKHIPAFGGDPKKVTIWGESAGAISVAFHMITNNGNTEGLFRGGWMESGAAPPYADQSKLQSTFDFIASETGCASAKDRLDCLREVSVESLTAAMDKTPSFDDIQALNTPWVPRADGVFLKDHPQRLILRGSVADIPFVTGNNKDEGTLFSLSTLNITTEQELAAYLKSNYFPAASPSNISRLLELYPEDPAAGSPFGTGDQFALTPEYKRISAFHGDFIFQCPRRFLLDHRLPNQVARSFFYDRDAQGTLGVQHGIELQNVFGGGDMTDFLVRFVNTLDPNSGSDITWPAYTAESPQLLAFVEGDTPLEVIPDTFREEPMDFLMQLGLEQPI